MKSKTTITVETYEISTVRVKRNRDATDSEVPCGRSLSFDVDAKRPEDTSDAAQDLRQLTQGDLDEGRTE